MQSDSGQPRVKARFLRTELFWLAVVLTASLVIYVPSLGNQLLFDDELPEEITPIRLH